MIDIHNHVIYQFDDGPKSLNESLEMLKMAADQGISSVFATSHFNELIRPEQESDYFNKLNILREHVQKKGIKVNLYSGGEIFFHHSLDKTIKKNRVTTLAELNHYVLMEFSMYFIPNGIEETLFKLTMDDYTPIVAHPERYVSVIENPEKCLRFIQHGALLQVNAGSILGGFGKKVQKAAMWILENQLAHFIASDAHTTQGRSFKLGHAAVYLEKHLDGVYIDQLVKENAEHIITNQRLEKAEIPEKTMEAEPNIFQRVIKRFKMT